MSKKLKAKRPPKTPKERKFVKEYIKTGNATEAASRVYNTNNKDQIVYDGFGGSGSTLIACEQTNRNCYMMELDPNYCDVIRKRYYKFIGKEEEWNLK